MDLQQFAREIGFTDAFMHQFMPHHQQLWEHSSEAFPDFMAKDFYTRYYPMCQSRFPEAEIYPLMDEVSARVRSDPAAARYASMLHYAFFVADPKIVLEWPSPTGIFGRNAGIFQLMIALSALPLAGKKHAQMGLPEKYALGLAQWIGGAMNIYAAAHDGFPGFTLRQGNWLRFTVNGELFRIGRLEFWPRPWPENLPAVYRERNSRRLAVLCRDGWAFDSRGFRVDPKIETPVFTTSLKFIDGKVTGTPVSPYGKPAFGKEITLDLKEWEPLCAPWERSVTVHIPAGGGLTTEAVRSSLLEAKQFFRKYFDWDIKVFSCGSWILNPEIEQELPDSNLAEWQRNVYLTPNSLSTGVDGTFFVYGEDCDPRTRPQTTRMHQALCRILDRGGRLCAGWMFLPADEAEFYGTQYYRKQYGK